MAKSIHPHVLPDLQSCAFIRPDLRCSSTINILTKVMLCYDASEKHGNHLFNQATIQQMSTLHSSFITHASASAFPASTFTVLRFASLPLRRKYLYLEMLSYEKTFGFFHLKYGGMRSTASPSVHPSNGSPKICSFRVSLPKVHLRRPG